MKDQKGVVKPKEAAKYSKIFHTYTFYSLRAQVSLISRQPSHVMPPREWEGRHTEGLKCRGFQGDGHPGP